VFLSPAAFDRNI